MTKKIELIVDDAQLASLRRSLEGDRDALAANVDQYERDVSDARIRLAKLEAVLASAKEGHAKARELCLSAFPPPAEEPPPAPEKKP